MAKKKRKYGKQKPARRNRQINQAVRKANTGNARRNKRNR